MSDELINLIRRALKWMEHKGGCKTYAPAKGGSAYDADDEDSCNCGLKRWQEEAKEILSRQSAKNKAV